MSPFTLHRECIIDKNARIGKNIVIENSEVSFYSECLPELTNAVYQELTVIIFSYLDDMQGVQEADRTSEGFYIRSGVTVILKNTTIKDGTVI